MPRPPISQQTATSLPLHGELSRAAPGPTTLKRTRFGGPLQLALEGRGWAILRPAVDFVLLWAAAIVAQGGVSATEHTPALRAPILALPLVVMLLFYLRGLYRTRLRPLLLDGVVPVVSAVSIGARSVAVFGVFVNGDAPPQSAGLRAWLFSLVAVGVGRVTLASAQQWARARKLVGKPVLIMGAGVVGAQVARHLQGHPEYGLAPVGFVDDDPPSMTTVGGRDLPVLGTTEELDEMVRSTGVTHLIVAFSSVA